MMGPFEALGSVFSRPFQFKGRASRAEFWWFVLFDVLFRLTFLALDGFLIYTQVQTGQFDITRLDPWSFFSVYYNLGILIPYLALSVRRLHDGGFSGFWMLLYPISTITSFGYTVLETLILFMDAAALPLVDLIQPFAIWILVVSIMSSLTLFVMLVWPSDPDDNIHGSPWRRLQTGPRTRADGSVRTDPMQAYALLAEMERKKSPEELAAREEARREEVRALYQQRVLGST